MVDLPTGTVTFLFSDIEGSTRLVQRLGDGYPPLLAEHQRLVRAAFGAEGGVVVGTEGDSFFAVFRGAHAAVAAAIDAQLALERHPWPEDGRIRVRIGLHTGEGSLGEDPYVGVDVHRAARIAAAAHGGQVLVSDSVRGLVDHALPAGVSLLDLGEHRLKDLEHPERLHQVVHPELQAEFPPPATLSRRPNLPAQISGFVGREAELSALRELLDDPAVQLLTLTGPGGTGKTRLALQAAAEHVERSDDPVVFVDLSSVREVEAAFEAIVRAVGAPGGSGRRPLDVLADHLADRRTLLLVDNLEQVMDAADGISELLQRCSELRIVVTSREALRIRGERRFDVPPMSLPEAAIATVAAAEVADSEAVRLFVERARDMRPDFDLTDDNAGAVAEVCARLDGLPLTIELAVARLELFSPDELRERLRDHLEPLSGGSRDLPARQRTLSGTIEWSERLLDPDDRTILRVLSVFSSAGVDAVERVAAGIDELRDASVPDGLLSLTAKSLVRSIEVDGRRRLSMLETIRQYAAERLEEEPALEKAARRAHAEHFSQLAQERRGDLSGDGRSDALEELETELGNLTSAWRYWVGAGDLGRLDMLLDGLWALHDDRGWYHGAVGLTNDLLAVLSTSPSTPERALEEVTIRTSLARGLMATRGYTEEVEEAYGRALAHLDQASAATPETLPLLRSLASLYLYRGEFEKGVTIGRQLLELAEELQDTSLEVEGHVRVGANLISIGEGWKGLEHLDRAIELFDPHQHVAGRFRLGASHGVVPHTTSAFALWALGYPDRAVEHGARAMDVAEEIGHPFTSAYALFHVALLDLWRGDWERVRERASSVLAIAEEHDYQVWRALALVFVGVSTIALGERDEGMALSDRGIGLYTHLTTPPVFWPLVLSVRTRGFAMAGRPAEGIEPVDQAIEMFQGRVNLLSPEFPLLKGDLLVALSELDEAESSYRLAFDMAVQAGARMTQLRASTRLVRLTRDGVAPSMDTVAALRSVYGAFTEGFESVDLTEARAVLDEIDRS
jgi:predicted ATPase/class 3 adenylate cyclase